MPLIFPEAQNFDCGSCTKCCRGAWNIHVDPHSFQQVHGSPLYQELERELGQPPMFVEDVEGDKTALTLMKDGGCVFLDKDRLCSIHRDMGVKAKPLGCRQFPFILRPTPDGVVVGVSYFCSAVQNNAGRTLSVHAEELEGMLKEYRYSGVGFRPIPLHDNMTISWEAYKLLEGLAVSCLGHDDLREGLWAQLMGTGLATAWLGRTPPPGLVSAVTPSLSDADLDKRLRAMPPVFIQRDEQFESLERMFLIGVVGVLESPNPKICKTNTEAVFMRRVVDSETFRCDIDLKHFDDFRTRFDPAWTLPHFRRYIDHLVFRKFLAHGRNIMANAAALYMTLPLLEWYRDLSAYVQRKLEPDISDVHLAFDVIERGFTTHTRGMDPFFLEMGSAFVSHLREILEGLEAR